ncbi:MAG: hypothetical protein R3C05_04935 [Pirellulaceae bacterium]
MNSSKYRLARMIALLATSFLLGCVFANVVFSQQASSEPVVARVQMQLRGRQACRHH